MIPLQSPRSPALGQALCASLMLHKKCLLSSCNPDEIHTITDFEIKSWMGEEKIMFVLDNDPALSVFGESLIVLE